MDLRGYLLKCLFLHFDLGFQDVVLIFLFTRSVLFSDEERMNDIKCTDQYDGYNDV